MKTRHSWRCASLLTFTKLYKEQSTHKLQNINNDILDQPERLEPKECKRK